VETWKPRSLASDGGWSVRQPSVQRVVVVAAFAMSIGARPGHLAPVVLDLAARIAFMYSAWPRTNGDARRCR
jgi:hypothetical protein